MLLREQFPLSPIVIRISCLLDKGKHGLAGLRPGNSRSPLTLQIGNDRIVRVMGRGSGRAAAWAKLFYHREGRPSLGVELAMDWHHLRAGIPWFGTMTAENLIAQGKYQLRLRSNAYEPAEAETTDFARLFGSNVTADIAVHLSPPLYAQSAPIVPCIHARLGCLAANLHE